MIPSRISFLLILFGAGLFMGGCAATNVIIHGGSRLPKQQRVLVKNYSAFMGDSVYLTKVDDSQVPSGTASVELSPGPHVLWTKFYRPPAIFTNVYKYSVNECWTKFIAFPGGTFRVNAFIGNDYWDPYLEDLESGEIVNLGFCGKDVRILTAPRPRVPFGGTKLVKKLIVHVPGNVEALDSFFRAGAYNAFRGIFSGVELRSSLPSSMPDAILLTVHVNDKSGVRNNESWEFPFSWELSYKNKPLLSGENVVISKESGDGIIDVALLIEGLFEMIGGPVSQWATSASKAFSR